MTFPNERLTTYAPDSEVKSADLNAIQDALVDHLKELGECFGAEDGQSYDVKAVFVPKATDENAPYWMGQGAAGMVTFPLRMRAGQYLIAAGLYVVDYNGEAVHAFVMKTSLWDGTAAQLGATQNSAGDGTRQLLQVTSLHEVVAYGYVYQIVFQCGSVHYSAEYCYGGYARRGPI